MTEPTDEQLVVIDGPAMARTLVEADPGTGKTFALIARSIHLAEELGEAVLVLSFTRAVVAEIRRRAAEIGGARLETSTIDGYAARVLLSAGLDLKDSFDATIRAATALVREHPELVPRPGHVLVDEVQDLGGPRLEFVLTILGHAERGFTALGDPKQAIYSWQGEEEDAFAALTASFPDVERRGLTLVHRPRVAALLKADAIDGEALLLDAKAMGSVSQAAFLVRRGRAVILTRTNGEALALADQLAALGARALVRQGAQARMAPSWVARFVNASPRDTWSRRQVTSGIESVAGAPPADEGWRVLRRVGRKDDGVSAESVRLAVLDPTRYDDFAFADEGAISTVHRAKGLEWDDVVVLEPLPEETRSEEEQRVLFVAATRARREVWRLRRPEFDGRLERGAGGRWERRTWQRRLLACEVQIGDVTLDRPFAADGSSAAEIQERLAAIDAGTAVALAFDEGRGRYVVACDGHLVAETTDAFTASIRQRWRGMPRALSGGRILTVRSAAGDPAAGDAEGLVGTGLWLAPEIVGFVGPENEEGEL